MGFADSVAANAAKMQQNVNDQITAITAELFTAIVENSPVNVLPEAEKRGELKNNWYTAFGQGNYNTTYSSVFDSNGSASLSQAALPLGTNEFLGKDSAISFTNIVPYGYIAEVLGWQPPYWTGRVGPYAMIRNSMTEVLSQYK